MLAPLPEFGEGPGVGSEATNTICGLLRFPHADSSILIYCPLYFCQFLTIQTSGR